ncbi:MAG: calcium-binding protein [Deltaproteobacteria bacterium]|nr:calcium-binding protein [Deltaproteobacteria bacterium]
MKRAIKRIHFRSLVPTAAAIATLSLSTGCGGSDTNEASVQDLFLDEASAYLSANDDEAGLDGDDIADAMAGATDASSDDVTADEASQDPPEPSAADAGEACDFSAFRARVKAHYDEDGDGKLSSTERANLRDDIGDLRTDRPRFRRLGLRIRVNAWQAVRWVFDEDGDKSLDEAERAVLIETFEARCEARRARILATYDADGNGQMDPEEIAAFRAAQRERLRAKRQEILDAYDVDENGILDLEERRAWKTDIVAALRARRAALRAQFDADEDGTLSEAELAALKAALREALASGNPLPPLT